MNVALWIVQGILAVMFLMVGMMKLTKSKEEMADSNAWVEDFSQRQVRGIGILEILGAVGLILPILLGILPILTPIAAIGLSLTMAGAFLTHLRRKELVPMGVMNIVLFGMAIFVAVGRFSQISFSNLCTKSMQKQKADVIRHPLFSWEYRFYQFIDCSCRLVLQKDIGDLGRICRGRDVDLDDLGAISLGNSWQLCRGHDLAGRPDQQENVRSVGFLKRSGHCRFRDRFAEEDEIGFKDFVARRA